MSTGVEMSKSPLPEVSVVIPAYNEGHAIGGLIAEVRRVAGDAAEIIVVDDGSSDATAREATAAGASVRRLGANQGKGAALRRGFEESSGRWVVTIDADGQDDPDDMPALLQAARNGADMVIGSRFIGTLHSGAISPLNAFATKAFNGLINLAFSASITDSQAGFRCFSRELLGKLSSVATEYEIETEMLLLALKAGATVVEVPVSRYPRSGGATSFSRVRHGLRILGTIVRCRLS